MADESQVFGISAEAAGAAKVAAAGGFGASILIYLRHPGTLLRAAMLIAIGVGLALIFATPLAKWTGLSENPAAALLGLLGKGIAEGLLRWVDAFDFGKILPGRK